jgi:chemotaxis protein CheD
VNNNNILLLGVGEFGASKVPGTHVKTLALGSCIAVVLLDPATRCVGMVHVALPDSSINAKRAKERPGYFADTGIPALIDKMTMMGCKGRGAGWIVKLIGGANVADVNNTFNVGKRNAMAIKKILWKLKMVPGAEDIGKNFSRTVSVDVSNGRVMVSCPGRGTWTV